MKKLLVFALLLFVNVFVFSQGLPLCLITEDHVNVRIDTSITSKVLGQLNSGDVVEGEVAFSNEDTVNGERNYWFRVETASFSGYVWGKFIVYILDIVKVSDTDIFIIDTSFIKGMYGEVVFQFSGLSTYKNKKIQKIVLENNEMEVLDKAYFFFGKENYLFVKYEFGDGGGGRIEYEMFQIDMEKNTTKKIFYRKVM